MTEHGAIEAPAHVAVDIGDDAGALVVRTGPEQLWAELEITLMGGTEHRTHVAVLPRPLGNATAYAAVFPSLVPGRYRLPAVPPYEQVEVVVEAGRVTDITV